MKKEEDVAWKVFKAVAEVAPHISSGLMHRREYVGEENPSNEEQMEADVWANEFLKEKITSLDGIAEFASEEEQKIIKCGKEGLSVTIDPLDGSSNIPTNNLVGTIVGVYNEKLPCKGKNLVSAFYILYGPLTTATYADKEQVNEYIIEEKPGDQIKLQLASEKIRLPEPQVYGFGGNQKWFKQFREFEDQISQDLKLRYGGSLVGDINQVLHQGGIFAYPSRTDAPQGKLRLLFEANPIAHIIKTAKGSSTDTTQPILGKKPGKLHQKTPFYTGNKELIKQAENTLKTIN